MSSSEHRRPHRSPTLPAPLLLPLSPPPLLPFPSPTTLPTPSRVRHSTSTAACVSAVPCLLTHSLLSLCVHTPSFTTISVCHVVYVTVTVHSRLHPLFACLSPSLRVCALPHPPASAVTVCVLTLPLHPLYTLSITALRTLPHSPSLVGLVHHCMYTHYPPPIIGVTCPSLHVHTPTLTIVWVRP